MLDWIEALSDEIDQIVEQPAGPHLKAAAKLLNDAFYATFQ
jgi:hypothetical protein